MKVIKQTCPECGRTLQMLEYGKGEIKCPRCGYVLKYEYKEGNEQRERRPGS